MCRKIKIHTTTTQIQNEKYLKLNKENITPRHSLKTKTNWNSKVQLCLIINTITQLNSLFLLFPIQQQPWHSNIMANKGLNLFDECDAECVHLTFISL